MTYIKLTLIGLYTLFLSVVALIFSFVDRSFKSYFWTSKIFANGVLGISGVKLKVTGLENLEKDKIYIYVSNH